MTHPSCSSLVPASVQTSMSTAHYQRAWRFGLCRKHRRAHPPAPRQGVGTAQLTVAGRKSVKPISMPMVSKNDAWSAEHALRANWSQFPSHGASTPSGGVATDMGSERAGARLEIHASHPASPAFLQGFYAAASTKRGRYITEIESRSHDARSGMFTLYASLHTSI